MPKKKSRKAETDRSPDFGKDAIPSAEFAEDLRMIFDKHEWSGAPIGFTDADKKCDPPKSWHSETVDTPNGPMIVWVCR